ncbi:hypothetical protein RJT34_24582 [Clitoria ternatea]|uniref:Uncharacterized protein n=1 Tax=Clitoria ternatea TaxID=43366 RepID=A0AAN9FQ08_CLITE
MFPNPHWRFNHSLLNYYSHISFLFIFAYKLPSFNFNSFDLAPQHFLHLVLYLFSVLSHSSENLFASFYPLIGSLLSG